jgi:hypothetical protein
LSFYVFRYIDKVISKLFYNFLLIRLVSDSSTIRVNQEDLDLEAPVNSNHPAHVFMRRIAPERQAVTLGELVELLKADQLAEIPAEETNNIYCTPDN